MYSKDVATLPKWLAAGAAVATTGGSRKELARAPPRRDSDDATPARHMADLVLRGSTGSPVHRMKGRCMITAGCAHTTLTKLQAQIQFLCYKRRSECPNG